LLAAEDAVSGRDVPFDEEVAERRGVLADLAPLAEVKAARARFAREFDVTVRTNDGLDGRPVRRHNVYMSDEEWRILPSHITCSREGWVAERNRTDVRLGRVVKVGTRWTAHDARGFELGRDYRTRQAAVQAVCGAGAGI
jgi:hypothetical protein